MSELGYEVAQSNVAFMLDRKEVPKFVPHLEIYTRAFLYLTRSAIQGSSTSRLKLGDYFYYGLGTDVNYEMAANQYQLASENQGSAQALFNLGYMYENGIGLKRDLHLAKRYYDQSADVASEAQVPVMLALTKLFFVIITEEFTAFWPKLPQFRFWELFLVTILVMIGTPLYFLRFPGALNHRRAEENGEEAEPAAGTTNVHSSTQFSPTSTIGDQASIPAQTNTATQFSSSSRSSTFSSSSLRTQTTQGSEAHTRNEANSSSSSSDSVE